MKRMLFGVLLFIGGLSMLLIIVQDSYAKYSKWNFDSVSYGPQTLFFSLVVISGLIICGIEAYKKDS